MQKTTGLDLLVERKSQKIRVYQVARELGLHPSSVSRLEGRAQVSAEQAQRYRDALARCVAPTTQHEEVA